MAVIVLRIYNEIRILKSKQAMLIQFKETILITILNYLTLLRFVSLNPRGFHCMWCMIL